MMPQTYFFLGSLFGLILAMIISLWRIKRYNAIHEEYDTNVQAIYKEEADQLRKTIDEQEKDISRLRHLLFQ